VYVVPMQSEEWERRRERRIVRAPTEKPPKRY